MYDIYHRTAKGDKLLVAEMDNGHLSNTISMFCRHIKTAKLMLQGEIKKDKFDQALFGSRYDLDEDDIKEIINKRTEQIQPYLGEAMLRGLNFTELLQDVFGRAEQIKFQDAKEIGLLINGPENDDSEYLNGDDIEFLHDNN